VSNAKDVEVFAEKTIEAFDAVHLLVNNAGVTASVSYFVQVVGKSISLRDADDVDVLIDNGFPVEDEGAVYRVVIFKGVAHRFLI